MIAGVYYESWNDWKAMLGSLDEKFNVVYLAFANPTGSYTPGAGFMGTGLNFSATVQTIKREIKKVQERGVTVMLSVGGATYPFPENFDGFEMVKLANVLGCNGIDIDWEPFEGSLKGWEKLLKLLMIEWGKSKELVKNYLPLFGLQVVCNHARGIDSEV